MGQVERDIETVKEGLRLMLTNRLEDADKHWNVALEEAKTRKIGANDIDPQAAFTFVGALTALLHGLATLQNDQLTFASERLQRADEFAVAMKDGPVKTVIKGLDMLLLGIVQTLQGNKTRGVWLVLRSWLWLKLLESEALNCEGPERGLVRSTALLALGIFNLILSLLPPVFVSTASWCSGLSGSRDVAMEFLRQCWQEDGALAPFAVLVLVGYQVDVRTWLGEPMDEASFSEANRALEWAEARFPRGIFFEGLRANYHAINRDLPKALELSNRLSDMAGEMPALGLVMHARRASYAQAHLDWPEAARAFRDALAVYQQVGRRSFVPAMALNAALCHEAAGEAKERDEMLALVREYKERNDKKNWDRPDKFAFDLAEEAKTGTWQPTMVLLTIMILHHRSTMFMSTEEQEKLLSMLKELAAAKDADADTRCRSLMLQAEVLRQSTRFEEALVAANAGLDLQPQLSKESAKMGRVQYLLFIVASSHFYSGRLKEAKDALKRLDAAPTNHLLYVSVLFKSAQLSKRLGLEIKNAYLEVTVGARDRSTFQVEIQQGCGEVEWEWVLDEHSLNFSAIFYPEGSLPELSPKSSASGRSPASSSASGAPKTMLQSLDGYQATTGPVTGRFEPPGPGTLVLMFDNKFSLMRSKKLMVRVTPEHLVLSPA